MYDFIVVGAGSAGCVLAARLSEDPSASVLLLEAGPEDKGDSVRIPLAWAKNFRSPFDWNYSTQPQPGFANRSDYCPRGKTLGGSSSINSMIYVRGNPRDYDRWRELGNPGWAFRDLLPYFMKAEANSRGASEFHGVAGPLSVSDPVSKNPLSKAFLAACTEIGIPLNDDFNGATQDGCGFYQSTTRNGRRCSTAEAYLRPALARPNLTVHSSSHATRIVFSNRRASAIEYLRGSQPQRAEARREIILAAGAINSPQLLLLSGVGPAAHLQSMGIPVVLDLPGVGQNLSDHPACGVTFHCLRPVSLLTAASLPNLLRYIFLRSGPLTSNLAEAGGFVRTSLAGDIPDIQLIFVPAFFHDHGFQNPPGHGYTIASVLLHPESRGSVSLLSPDPLAAPAIQPNSLAAENDVNTLVSGILLGRRIGAAIAFNPFRGAEAWPGEPVQSESDLVSHLRAHAQTCYHPVGTCKMGADSASVVDASLRVRNLQGLRVADASIMPEIIGGNTNAPTIMIAEKAADLIKSTAA